MKRKQFHRLVEQLARLETESSSLLDEVATDEPLIMGCLSEVLRTCGKPTCRCAQEPCHKHFTLMTTQQGKRRCQVVRKTDVEMVSEKVRRYRVCRHVLSRLRAIEKQKHILLKELIEARNDPYE